MNLVSELTALESTGKQLLVVLEQVSRAKFTKQLNSDCMGVAV